MKEGVVDMMMRQEVYEKIMRLPEDGIKLILVMADEIARQCGVFTDKDTEKEKSLLLENKKKAFQDMLYCAPLSFTVHCAVYTPRRHGCDCKSLRRGV